MFRCRRVTQDRATAQAEVLLNGLGVLAPRFSVLGQIIRDFVPRRARIDECVKLRADSRIIIESTHSNRYLWTVRPIAAEQARPANLAEGFHCAFAFAVHPDQLLASKEAKLFFQHACLRTDSSPGMFAAAITMTMVRSNERRFDFETHSAAETTATNNLAHEESSNRSRAASNQSSARLLAERRHDWSSCASANHRSSSALMSFSVLMKRA